MGLPAVVVAQMATEIGKEAMSLMNDYMKCKQVQITERKRISAALKIITKQIESNKEMYLTGIEKYYEERHKLYDMANESLKKATETSDMEMMKFTYNFILTVYNQGDSKLDMLTKQNQISNNGIINFIE